MSQNFFFEDNKIIFMGWDKPTQSAFLTLGELSESGYDWVEPLLIENDYVFDRDNNMDHIDEISVAIKGRLAAFGLCIPNSMYQQMNKDISSNSVNVTRIHYKESEPRLYSGDPVFDGVFKEQREKIQG